MKKTLTVVALGLAATADFAQDFKLKPKAAEVDYDRRVDFTRYLTFAWAPFQEPLANRANQVRMTRALERELKAKGLTRHEGLDADLFVHFVVRMDEKVKGTPYEGGAAWQPSNQRLMVRLDKVKVGTLAVELWDAKTRDIVWSASVADVIARLDEIPEQIDEAAKRVIAPYPPPSQVLEGGPDVPKP